MLDLKAIRERHQPEFDPDGPMGGGWQRCKFDKEQWPCERAALIEELTRVQEANEELEAAGHKDEQAIEVVRGLRARAVKAEEQVKMLTPTERITETVRRNLDKGGDPRPPGSHLVYLERLELQRQAAEQREQQAREIVAGFMSLTWTVKPGTEWMECGGIILRKFYEDTRNYLKTQAPAAGEK